MNNNNTFSRRGLAPIAITFIVVAALALIGGGVVFYMNMNSAGQVANNNPPVATSTDTGSTTPTSTATSTPSGVATSSASSTATSTPPSKPAPLVIKSVSPKSGPVGTVVVITGSGFGSSSVVTMNGLVAASTKNLVSTDGKTIEFTIPQTISANCTPPKACPLFLVRVDSSANPYALMLFSNGQSKSLGNFTVTATPPPAPSY